MITALCTKGHASVSSLTCRSKIVALFVAGFLLCFSKVYGEGKIPQIGVLLVGGKYVESFREGLRDVGYIEGKNIIVEYRFTRGNLQRALSLAVDLIKKNVDLIVTAGTRQAKAIQQATTKTPILVALSGDLVEAGLATSFARPGGNITGFSMRSAEVSGKRMELLKEAVPKSSRIGVLWDDRIPENAADFRTTQDVARRMRLEVESLQVQRPEDIIDAF